MEKKWKHKSDPIVRQMLKNAALGIIITEISGAVTYVIDAAVTSRFLGEKALAATNMAGICYTIAAVFSGVLSGGAQQIATSKIGRGNVKEANRFFSMVLSVTFALSLLISVIGFAGASAIAHAVGVSSEDTELLNQTIQYIRGFAIGTPANILIVVLIPFVQLEGKNKEMWLGACALFAADTLGDLFNVLVFHGGVFGMGLATSISFWANLLVLYSVFLRKESMFQFRIRNMDFHELKNMITIGLPKATKRIGNILRPLFLNRIILTAGGSAAMAAYAVQSSTKYVTESIGTGIAGAAFLLVGIFISEKNQTALRSTIKLSLRCIIFYIGGIAAVYFAAAPLIVTIFYSANSASYQWAVQVLRCHAVSLPFLAFNEFYINCIHSAGKINTAHIITLIERFILITVLSAIMGRLWGAAGVWIAIAANEILLCAGILIINAIKSSRNPRRNSIVSFVDDQLQDEGEYLELSIYDKSEITHMTDELKTFCQNQKLDSRQTYHVQLFFEEMCMLIIDHGFDEKKKHLINVRIYKDKNDLILRTKDDCRAFTAAEQDAMYREAKEGKFMGIQMVVRMAKDVKYVNSMNINNFIVTL